MKVTVKIEEKSFEVEVGDVSARPILATVDGEVFEVWPEETAAPEPALSAPAATAPVAAPRAAPRPAAAASPAPAAGGAGSVNAPLPGSIVAVSVKVGDQVTQGQDLMTLEAMKMKNSIRSPRAGRVSNVYVAVGDKVRHGQALVELD